MSVAMGITMLCCDITLCHDVTSFAKQSFFQNALVDHIVSVQTPIRELVMPDRFDKLLVKYFCVND